MESCLNHIDEAYVIHWLYMYNVKCKQNQLYKFNLWIHEISTSRG